MPSHAPPIHGSPLRLRPRPLRPARPAAWARMQADHRPQRSQPSTQPTGLPPRLRSWHPHRPRLLAQPPAVTPASSSTRTQISRPHRRRHRPLDPAQPAHDRLGRASPAAGIRTGILSNIGDAMMRRHPRRAALARRLQPPHLLHTLKLAKPDPRSTATPPKASTPRPENILFIDDREVNIDAARASACRPSTTQPRLRFETELAVPGLAPLWH